MADIPTSINFDDLAPVQIPVTVKGVKYLLCEASGDAATKWRNANVAAARYDDGKMVGVDGIANSEPLLVSLCLCETNPDGGVKYNKQGDPCFVPIRTIRAWPARIQRKLHDTIKQISDLDEAETREVLEKRLADTEKKLAALDTAEGKDTAEGRAKNAPGATPAGSS